VNVQRFDLDDADWDEPEAVSSMGLRLTIGRHSFDVREQDGFLEIHGARCALEIRPVVANAILVRAQT
jgi:hypothetical protein